MGSAKHYDLTTGLDRSIPFMPGWSFIYLGCFLFWAVNYILITRQSREEWFQFATGDYLSRLICGIFFVLLPTTNIRPEIVGDGVDPFYLPDRCTDQSVSVDSLSGKLDVFYRNSR